MIPMKPPYSPAAAQNGFARGSGPLVAKRAHIVTGIDDG